MLQRLARLGCLVGALAVAAPSGARGEAVGSQWHALKVAGGADALARAAGIEPGLPAWRVFYDAVRRRHGLWGEDAGRFAASEASADAAGSGVVPLPLAPSFWRGLQRAAAAVPDERLAFAILADRRSAHLYRGLAGYDEATLSALAAEPETLRAIQRRQAGVLAAFGARFAVRDGVVAVPGGDAARPSWEALVGESTGRPARFLARMLAKGEGRLALLYDSVARLPPARQRLALGVRDAEGGARPATLRALWRVFEAESAWWQRGGAAFARGEVDAARLLREVRLTDDGRIAPPVARAFWEAVFDAQPATPDAIRSSPPVDVAWLADRIGRGDPRVRRLRLEQLSFAQRVFGEAADGAPLPAIEALSGLVDARALVLALERLGSRDPAFFAAAVSGARRSLAFQVPEDLAAAHAGFQGALGVIDRARFAGSLGQEQAERLVRSLLDVPLPGAVPWERGLGGWVAGTLVPELAAAAGGDAGEPEAVVLRALAGASRARRREGPGFEWEGLLYRVEPERAELRRLEGVRRRQAGPSLGAALRGCREAGEKERHACAGSVGAVLTSLVYAWHLGEPDGPALRGEDPSRRHAFLPQPWDLAAEVSGPGIDWHVRGSLLGLETALARVGLHRLGDAMPARAPVIDALQRRRLVVAAGLIDPLATTDAGGEELAAALDRGRSRALALRPGDAELDAVARDAGLDPWRARALEWLLEHEPAALAGFFSLGELAFLGGAPEGRFDAWGAPDVVVSGLRPRLHRPRPLDEAAGRPPEPALAEGFVDLPIRAAAHLRARGLPASLARGVVATLLPELFFEARPVAPDDRLALEAWVRAVPTERLDDAVASLVGRGALQPAAPGASTP